MASPQSPQACTVSPNSRCCGPELGSHWPRPQMHTRDQVYFLAGRRTSVPGSISSPSLQHSSSPKLSTLESGSLGTSPVWDDTQAGTLHPHLARKTYYKSQQKNLALRAHSPAHMLPEAAGQEPVMAERPALTLSTGSSSCTESTAKVSAAMMAPFSSVLCFSQPVCGSFCTRAST